MKTIQVKYLGPTNHRDTRYKAWAEGWGSVTVSRDYSLSDEQNERLAAEKLLEKVYDDKDINPYKFKSEITDFAYSNHLPNGDAVFILQNQEEYKLLSDYNWALFLISEADEKDLDVLRERVMQMPPDELLDTEHGALNTTIRLLDKGEK